MQMKHTHRQWTYVCYIRFCWAPYNLVHRIFEYRERVTNYCLFFLRLHTMRKCLKKQSFVELLLNRANSRLKPSSERHIEKYNLIHLLHSPHIDYVLQCIPATYYVIYNVQYVILLQQSNAEDLELVYQNRNLVVYSFIHFKYPNRTCAPTLIYELNGTSFRFHD